MLIIQVCFWQNNLSWILYEKSIALSKSHSHCSLADHYSEVKVTMTFNGEGPRVQLTRIEERRKTAIHFSVCKKKDCMHTCPFNTPDTAEIAQFDSYLSSSGLDNRKKKKWKTIISGVFLFTHFLTNTFNFSFRQQLTVHKVLRINCTVYKISTTKTIHRRGSAGWVWRRGVNDKNIEMLWSK